MLKITYNSGFYASDQISEAWDEFTIYEKEVK